MPTNIFKKIISGFKRERIYLDYASLTPIDPRITAEVMKYSGSEYANPSSLYKEGVSAKKALLSGRKNVADFLHGHSDEIYFTSGGTEANNLALFGSVQALHNKGVDYVSMHVLVSAIEHSSVRETANYLSDMGVQISVIPVDSNGIIDLAELKKNIQPNTVIVSIMMVNNEIGTIEPIRDIAKIVRQSRASYKGSSAFNFQDEFTYPILHTDAAQGMYQDMNVEKLGIDLLTLDGTKIYGPRGIGALYIRRGTPVASIIKGGGQENGMRSGTENLPGIMGFALALDILKQENSEDREYKHLAKLRKYFIDELKKLRSDISVHGPSDSSREISPHILNISIPGIDNEFFVLQLDAKGIACSTKSSCLRDEDESYVLKSIGAKSKESVRFSLGRFTKKSDIDRAIEVISETLK